MTSFSSFIDIISASLPVMVVLFIVGLSGWIFTAFETRKFVRGLKEGNYEMATDITNGLTSMVVGIGVLIVTFATVFWHHWAYNSMVGMTDAAWAAELSAHYESGAQVALWLGFAFIVPVAMIALAFLLRGLRTPTREPRGVMSRQKSQA